MQIKRSRVAFSGQAESSCLGNLQHSAEVNSDKQRHLGASMYPSRDLWSSMDISSTAPTHQHFIFTSFCSGGLLCGCGHATATLFSSSNSGTWNSEAESRSLLTAESVTKQDFGTKAGNGGSSLAPWKEKQRRKI